MGIAKAKELIKTLIIRLMGMCTSKNEEKKAIQDIIDFCESIK